MGVYDVLVKETDHITAVFYNPNIEPKDEYCKRRDACADYARKNGIDFVEISPADDWQQVDKTHERPCFSCYLLRLGQTAQWAADKDYDSFATTLSISPWQNLDAINEAGMQVAEDYSNLSFEQHNFRNCYRKAQNKARILGIYRQNYCGCLPSKNKKKDL